MLTTYNVVSPRSRTSLLMKCSREREHAQSSFSLLEEPADSFKISEESGALYGNSNNALKAQSFCTTMWSGPFVRAQQQQEKILLHLPAPFMHDRKCPVPLSPFLIQPYLWAFPMTPICTTKSGAGTPLPPVPPISSHHKWNNAIKTPSTPKIDRVWLFLWPWFSFYLKRSTKEFQDGTKPLQAFLCTPTLSNVPS